MNTHLHSEQTPPVQDDTVPTLYCANHPGRETMLRCNRCNKPICYECAVRTPVGYRCKECVRGQQSIYFTGSTSDLAIGAAVALVLSAIVGAIAFTFLGIFGFFSFLIAFFLGPVVGGLLAEAVRQAVRRRRARYLREVVIVATIAGILLGGLLLFAPAVFSGAPLAVVLASLPRLLVRLDVLLFTVLILTTIYARLQ